MSLLKETRHPFEMSLPRDVVQLSALFKDNGHQLYVVGGAVRDAVVGKEPKDYDLATDAIPDRVIDILEGANIYRILEIGKSFGVVKVITPDKNEYEIATFRQDIGKGRRPTGVEFTSIENDVLRRDLTVNALFYDIDSGEVVDLVGGLDDIKNNIVRAVGDPVERFDEDRLRILRAIRFAGRMGSEIDKQTAAAIDMDNSLNGVSPERIRDEFLKGMLSAKSVTHFFDMIEEYDLWPQIFPGLNVSRIEIESRNVPVVLARLLWANDPATTSKRLNNLKYTSIEASQVSFLLRLKDLNVNNAFKMKKAFMTSHLSDEDIREFAALKGTPSLKIVDAFIEYVPSIKSDALMARGLKGAELGKEIERLETEIFRKML
jgi:tRNA nucleotidyltransferase/poly(A) polymerase